MAMSATRILWGQVLVVLAIVLATTWAATQWVAWKLGYQPREIGPGGGGCFASGTLVTMADGSLKRIELVEMDAGRAHH